MRAKDSQTENEALTVKTCSICNQVKPLTDFFAKRLSHESFCKSCKKNKRSQNAHIRTNGIKAHKPSATVAPPDWPSIEPESSRHEKFWDMKYGRQLSELEEFEIQSNVQRLMNLLFEAPSE